MIMRQPLFSKTALIYFLIPVSIIAMERQALDPLVAAMPDLDYSRYAEQESDELTARKSDTRDNAFARMRLTRIDYRCLQAWKLPKADTSAPSAVEAGQNATAPSAPSTSTALYRLVVTHRDNPVKAAEYFMKAQLLREGALVDQPRWERQITLSVLTESTDDIVIATENDAKEPLAIMKKYAQANHHAGHQALAFHHSKNAECREQLTLLSLTMAKRHLDTLDPKAAPIIPEFNHQNILFNYYRYLYQFASQPSNYAAGPAIVPFSNYLFSLSNLAEAMQGLKMLAPAHPRAYAFHKAAQHALRNGLLNARRENNMGLLTCMQRAKTDPAHAAILHESLITRMNIRPISAGQRKVLVECLKTLIPDSSLVQSLIAKKYAESVYAHRATTLIEPGAQDYQRALFAADCGDTKSALTLSSKSLRAGYQPADVFFKNLLLISETDANSSDTSGADALCIARIKSALVDSADPLKTIAYFPLYCDAISSLERMRGHNSLPALHLLLHQHLAYDMHQEHSLAVIQIMKDTGAILKSSGKSPFEFFDGATTDEMMYWCEGNHYFEPLYVCMQLIIECLQKNAKSPEIAQAEQRLRSFYDFLNHEYLEKKDKSCLVQKGPIKAELMNLLVTILNDKNQKTKLAPGKYRTLLTDLHGLLTIEQQTASRKLDEVLTANVMGMMYHLVNANKPQKL